MHEAYKENTLFNLSNNEVNTIFLTNTGLTGKFIEIIIIILKLTFWKSRFKDDMCCNDSFI